MLDVELIPYTGFNIKIQCVWFPKRGVGDPPRPGSYNAWLPNLSSKSLLDPQCMAGWPDSHTNVLHCGIYLYVGIGILI